MKEPCLSPDLVTGEQYHTTRKTLWNHSDQFHLSCYTVVCYSHLGCPRLSFYGYLFKKQTVSPSAKVVPAPLRHSTCVFEAFTESGKMVVEVLEASLVLL